MTNIQNVHRANVSSIFEISKLIRVELIFLKNLDDFQLSWSRLIKLSLRSSKTNKEANHWSVPCCNLKVGTLKSVVFVVQTGLVLLQPLSTATMMIWNIHARLIQCDILVLILQYAATLEKDTATAQKGRVSHFDNHLWMHTLGLQKHKCISSTLIISKRHIDFFPSRNKVTYFANWQHCTIILAMSPWVHCTIK